MASKLNHRPVTQDGLFGLMQNDALSVIALHSFVLGYHTIAKNRKSDQLDPKLTYLFYVLPIVYNHAAMLSFLNSHEVYTALAKERSIIISLQERANKMVFQTFDGLNLAFSKKILSIDKEQGTISLLRPYSSKKLLLTKSAFLKYDSVKQIQDSAFKLGSIFAKKHPRIIQTDLNICF